MGERDRALALLAGRQHGVVSVRQLEQQLEFSHQAIERAVAAGRLHRIYRGVYAVGHTDLSAQGRCLAAVLAVGPGALLSYHSAGWLWGIWRGSPEPFEVTAFVPRHHRPPRGVVRHRARNLVDDDRAMAGGIPVTSIARTLLDLAWKLPAHKLRRCLARAEELELLDLDAIRAVIDRNRGHHGAKHLRQALDIYEPTPAPNSSGASSITSPTQACRGRPPAGTRSATSSTSTGPSSASASNSTATRRTVPATPLRVTTIATSRSRWPGSRRSASANVSFCVNPTRSPTVSRPSSPDATAPGRD
jgi:predicted transcriptional regulator of viral defense system